MAERFQCTSGHQWSAEAGGGVEAATASCPVCGAAAETTLSPAAPPDATESAPLGPAAPPGNPELPNVPGYELLRVLGKGGMGVVYQARHRALGRDVALKVILSAEHAQPEELARFRAEAETAARLRHPNIVTIYELGEAHGRPFFAMELVAGGSLKARLGRGPLPDREAATLLLKLARAAAYAHAQRVVHRDLKPDNVLLAEDGEPKITDFGVAKRLGGGAGLTATGALVGTPAYMAPEQAAGKKDVGPAADVYALGAILYECLAGRVPFAGDSMYDTLHKVLTEDPVSPAWHRPSISRDLEKICLKCLRKTPGQRYAGAADLADDLERYLAHRPIRARRTPPWERALKWGRRHPTAATLLLLAALLVGGAAGAGWWYYDHFVAVHITYFANWTKRWGACEGFGRLTDEQVRNRPYSFKFYTRAGKVERVDAVDAQGELTNQHPTLIYMDSFEETSSSPPPECYFKFERDAQGRVSDEIAYDRHDRPVLRFHYTSQGSPTLAAFTDGNGYPVSRVGSGATFIEFKRDQEGRDVELHYRDKENQPRPDSDGAYGWRMEYDGEGVFRRVTYLDAEDHPFRATKGYATLEIEPDSFGFFKVKRYFDENGRPVQHKDGWWEIHDKCDAYGRIVEETYRDKPSAEGPGKPVRSRYGVVRARTTFTSPDDFVTEYLDENDRPTSMWGDAVKYRQEVVGDRRSGRTVTVAYLDKSDHLTRGISWAAGWKEVDDPDGRPLEKSYFGPDGEPTFIREGYAGEVMEGYAREVMKYESGKMVEWEGYDTKGNLTRNSSWYARRICKLDDRGRCTDEAYFGPDRQPTLCKNGYARKHLTYDADGNLHGEEYFGVDDKPTRCRDGYSRVVYDYDSNGHVKEESYFGPDGKPTWHKKGYGRLLKSNDPRGYVLTRTALAPDGKPVMDWDGHCEIRYEYDDWGNTKKESYYGTDGTPLLSPEGAASIERTFDRFGNALTLSYFGLHGERVLCKAGYWQERAEHDEAGQIKRQTFHDTDGSPRLTAEHVAEVRRDNDSHDQPVDTGYFDTEGKPILKDGKYARVVNVYDDRGLSREESYFGTKPNEPANGEQGFAVIRREHDPRGRITSERYIGPDNQPARSGDGYSGIDWVYNDRGLKIEESYVDGEGKPLAVGGRYVGMKIDWDPLGNLIDGRFCGLKGELVPGPDDWARTKVDYDERDNKVSQTFFGPDKLLCLSREGNARVAWKYNDCDELLETMFYGPDDHLKVLPGYGYAQLLQTYDAHGNLLTLQYFDADKKPMNGPDGYARMDAAYDEADHRTDRTYQDRDGHKLHMAVVVTGVDPKGAGDRLGLKPGDVFMRYDGKDVVDADSFIRGRNAELPGDPKRVLRVRRGQKELEFPVAPGRMNVDVRDRFVRDLVSSDKKKGEGKE